jgi:hypothetical protein
MSLYSKQYSSITGAVECASLAKCFRIFRSLVHCYTSILEFLFSDYSIHYTRKVTEEGYPQPEKYCLITASSKICRDVVAKRL